MHLKKVFQEVLGRIYCSDVEKIEKEHWGLVETAIETLNFGIGSESETDTASDTGTVDWESDISSHAGC